MLATIWQVLHLQHMQSPETKIMQICWNQVLKIREITSGELFLAGFSHLKPLCGGSGGGRSQSSVDFLISSEETGFRHLYYVKAELNMGNQIPEGKGFEGCGVHRGIL